MPRYEPIGIPALRGADVPRRYKLAAKLEIGLEPAIRKLEKVLAERDIRRQRFPNVGEDINQKIRR